MKKTGKFKFRLVFGALVFCFLAGLNHAGAQVVEEGILDMGVQIQPFLYDPTVEKNLITDHAQNLRVGFKVVNKTAYALQVNITKIAHPIVLSRLDYSDASVSIFTPEDDFVLGLDQSVQPLGQAVMTYVNGYNLNSEAAPLRPGLYQYQGIFKIKIEFLKDGQVVKIIEQAMHPFYDTVMIHEDGDPAQMLVQLEKKVDALSTSLAVLSSQENNHYRYISSLMHAVYDGIRRILSSSFTPIRQQVR